MPKPFKRSCPPRPNSGAPHWERRHLAGVFLLPHFRGRARPCSGSTRAPRVVFRARAENPLAPKPFKRSCHPARTPAPPTGSAGILPACSFSLVSLVATLALRRPRRAKSRRNTAARCSPPFAWAGSFCFALAGEWRLDKAQNTQLQIYTVTPLQRRRRDIFVEIRPKRISAP